MTKRPVRATAILRLRFILFTAPLCTLLIGACSSATPSPTAATKPSSPTVSSVAVNGSTDFTSVGQAVQLTATATPSVERSAI